MHICLAESQSAGKGRLGRSWHSPFGLNFYGSIGFSWAADIQALQGLSLAVSVSILRALTSLQIPEIGLKWPNDIVYKGQKLSGILIEVQAEMNGKLHVIIGIGLNINALPESGIDAITQPWTSLRQITGKSFDRNHVTCTLINQLLQDLHLFKQEGCASFMKDWKIYDVLKGKTLSLIQGDRVLRGVADGVDATGQLRLKTDQGLELFSSGDASIVKEKGKEA
ncbi:MAG: biotin--[acetyl-CoA-carboxylase] ligase [Gammaproteobacteria bacterium]|nr:biotin--[acetyl-CoA-carboxylase] ligase [Gammaproteobacteria bacterium]